MADHLPNILFVTTDQHRCDAVGFMGSGEVHTPNLDRLAASGVAFERVYVTNPGCMPSRATFLTGQFLDSHDVRRNGIEVPDQPWGIGRVFGENGYRTGMFGKTHFSALRRDYQLDADFHNWKEGETYYGFEERAVTHDLKDYISDLATAYYREHDRPANLNFTHDDYLDWMEQEHPAHYPSAVREGLVEGQQPLASEPWTSDLPPELHQSRWIADQTMSFIDRHQEEPWFAWCSFVDPHHPFNAPGHYRNLYDTASFEAPVWDDTELERRSPYHQERFAQQRGVWQEHWREYRAQDYGMISLIDDQVGRLIDHLERSNFRERTIIVYTADHGELLGDHGLSRKGLLHYEPLIRVPLQSPGPARFRRGSGSRESSKAWICRRRCSTWQALTFRPNTKVSP